MNRLSLVTAIALLGLAACSSDSSSEGTTASTTASTTAADTTVAGSDTTTAASDTTGGGSDTTVAGGDGAGSEFCDVNEELNNSGIPIDGTSTPAEIEEYFTVFFPDAVSRLSGATPPELEADVTMLIEGVQLLGTVLEESDWDVNAAFADPRLTDLLSSDDFNLAGERVDAFCAG